MKNSNEFIQDKNVFVKDANMKDRESSTLSLARYISPTQKNMPLTIPAYKAKLHSAIQYDEAMKQQQKALPSMDEMKAKWKLQVGAAMLVWDKLTEAELLESEGHKKNLVDLLQEYHAFSRDEANKQVNGFFEKHMSARSL